MCSIEGPTDWRTTSSISSPLEGLRYAEKVIWLRVVKGIHHFINIYALECRSGFSGPASSVDMQVVLAGLPIHLLLMVGARLEHMASNIARCDKFWALQVHSALDGRSC